MTSGHDQYLSGGSKYKWLVETDGPVQGTDKVPSLSAAWRNKLTESQGFPPSLENVTTCYELFQRSARLYGSRRCLGWRRREEPGAQLGPYDFMTFQEACEICFQSQQPWFEIDLKCHIEKLLLQLHACGGRNCVSMSGHHRAFLPFTAWTVCVLQLSNGVDAGVIDATSGKPWPALRASFLI